MHFLIAINRTSRKIETRQRFAVPLTPIRRVLFTEASPVNMEIETPKASHSIAHMITPNWRQQFTPIPHHSPAILISSPGYIQNEDYALAEETFTVMSILKEINMEKYCTLFAREEVDLLVFLMLTREDMVELGIDRSDHNILLNTIRCYSDVFGNPEKMYF